MTSFVAWIGVDQRGPASLYLASDSRISWGAAEVWNSGRKVFAASAQPDLLGYVGDVLFPSLVLGQLVEAINVGALYPANALPQTKFETVRSSVEESFHGVPATQRRPFTILYATREHTGLSSRFHLWSLAWNHSWVTENIHIPAASSAITVLGSGATIVGRWATRWDATSQGGTSRAVFSALCDAISSGSDPSSGGPPQLVGLFRIDSGRSFGVHWNGRPYYLGLPVDPGTIPPQPVEWRNRLFERTDARGTLLLGAQRHSKPKGLGA